MAPVRDSTVPRGRVPALRGLRYALIGLAGLLLLGALGLVLVVVTWLYARRRWPGRRWRWWSKVGVALLAAIGSAMLGLVITSNVHATRLPGAASATQCTFANGLTAENMASLFYKVARTYGKAEPIKVYLVGPARDNTVLVALPGQVTNHMGAAIKAGLGVTGDVRADQTDALIKQFQIDHKMPSGTWVILAGHSYGGIIAQLLADTPHMPDYRIAAVVTWGAPSVGPHASGVAYQQYFSHYDMVPMLSTYQLAWPVSLGGVIGGFGDLVGMQIFPPLKGMHSGQTYVPDMSEYWWPGNWIHTDGTWNDAHDGYGDSAWMGTQTLAFSKGAATCVLLTRS
jgi:hypothetical protein